MKVDRYRHQMAVRAAELVDAGRYGEAHETLRLLVRASEIYRMPERVCPTQERLVGLRFEGEMELYCVRG